MPRIFHFKGREIYCYDPLQCSRTYDDITQFPVGVMYISGVKTFAQTSLQVKNIIFCTNIRKQASWVEKKLSTLLWGLPIYCHQPQQSFISIFKTYYVSVGQTTLRPDRTMKDILFKLIKLSVVDGSIYANIWHNIP